MLSSSARSLTDKAILASFNSEARKHLGQLLGKRTHRTLRAAISALGAIVCDPLLKPQQRAYVRDQLLIKMADPNSDLGRQLATREIACYLASNLVTDEKEARDLCDALLVAVGDTNYNAQHAALDGLRSYAGEFPALKLQFFQHLEEQIAAYEALQPQPSNHDTQITAFARGAQWLGQELDTTYSGETLFVWNGNSYNTLPFSVIIGSEHAIAFNFHTLQSLPSFAETYQSKLLAIPARTAAAYKLFMEQVAEKCAPSFPQDAASLRTILNSVPV